MLRHNLGLSREADAIEEAVECALADGLRTPDLVIPGTPKSETCTWCSSAKRENFNRVSISNYHENITTIINSYYKEITRTPTLECTLECYEKL